MGVCVTGGEARLLPDSRCFSKKRRGLLSAGIGAGFILLLESSMLVSVAVHEVLQCVTSLAKLQLTLHE